MKKTILITGSTDGIGLETAKLLAKEGHQVLLHGRSAQKLTSAAQAVEGESEDYIADLSKMSDVAELADEILSKHDKLDVLINNAGVFKTSQPLTEEGLDIRFVVNTLAPYVLTQRLMPILAKDGRIVNLSSAAQASVNLDAMRGAVRLDDMQAYAQSKLAITMWSQHLATQLGSDQIAVAVNPGSLLASKMVKEGFGVAGNDIGIGADILRRAALSEEFIEASGKYFDNDEGRFNYPHHDANDETKVARVVAATEEISTSLIAAGQ